MIHKRFYLQIYILIFIISLLLLNTSQRAVVVNGGQVSLKGAVTDTQIDLKIDYTSNVKWILLIWGPDQVNTDAHLFLVDQNNAANPVQVKDCYINQNSFINQDDVNNIMPSITTFTGNIQNGIKAAYNRDLNTGDSQDIRLYINSVVQVCFISSSLPFQGNGFQKGQEKVCSFLSLHKASDDYELDRLLGNYAGTSLIGGANLTFYATKSTDEGRTQPWLFLSVVHKQQGLAPFSPKWIAISYQNSLTNIDLAMISYQTLNFKLQVHTRDMFAQSSTSAKQDQLYVVNQGGNDIVKVYGAYDPNGYFVASFKRKFSTGDINRDTDLVLGVNNYCFIYGNNIAYSTFVQPQKTCLNFTLKTSYMSNFRIASKNSTTNQNGLTVIEYTPPKNKISTKKKSQNLLVLRRLLIVIILGFLIL